MRIVFLGTPEFGVPSLRALLHSGHEVVGVFTQPDKPKGRGNKMMFSPVKEFAVAHDIPVYQPVKIKRDGVEDMRALKPDLCVTAAFGQILSQELLDIPRLGTVNVHSSLLPKYRGSSPIAWCLYNGEKVTGVTTMLTDKGMDTGDILLQRECEILPDDTAGTLTSRLADMGAALLIETLSKLESGNCPRSKQDESQMSYFPMLNREMGRLNFSRDAQALCNQVRGFDPWPGTYFNIHHESYKVWKAEAVPDNEKKPCGAVCFADGKQGLGIQTSNGVFRVIEIQAPGGKRMNAWDYFRGHRLNTQNVDCD